MVKGKVTFKTQAGGETFETGDAYYVGPGHTPVLYAGTEVIEFSPTAELQQTSQSLRRTWRPPRPDTRRRRDVVARPSRWEGPVPCDGLTTGADLKLLPRLSPTHVEVTLIRPGSSGHRWRAATISTRRGYGCTAMVSKASERVPAAARSPISSLSASLASTSARKVG